MATANVVPADGSGRLEFTRRLQFILDAARGSLAPFGPALIASLGVAGCTWVSFELGQTSATVGFLYLVAVVLTAVYSGFWQATWISIISVACLDYFFNPPIFSFTVDRLSNWVELAVFEFTALIINQLSNRAHLRELEAVAERRDTERLYQTARRILLFESPKDSGEMVTSLFREVFDLSSVILFDAPPNAVYGQESLDDQESIIEAMKQSYFLDSDRYDPKEKTWYCVLRLGLRPVGALTLFNTTMKKLTATALASLAAIAMERSRALQKQYHAEAARQAEQLRAAVLDSLAHQFKTPLTVIRTASSGLPAAGQLSDLQTELVSMIDQEARKLNDLASRLVGTPKLDSKEFAPQPEPVLLSRLMKSAIQELERSEDRDRFQIVAPVHEPAVFADRELILTALAQLIDNAVKYSVPGSPIEAGLLIKDSAVVLSIRSMGLVVEPAEREHIFERFYRAPGARSAGTGTGLGLSIVKTIATDLQGHVWADGEPGYGTIFSLSLPSVLGGSLHGE